MSVPVCSADVPSDPPLPPDHRRTGLVESLDENYRRISVVLPQIPALMPVRLAMALRETLMAAGVSLNLFRAGTAIPIGASDDIAAGCQWHHTRTGPGPSTAAHQTGQQVEANTAELRRRWPALDFHIDQHTSYQTLISLPITRSGVRFTLDVWFSERQPAIHDLRGAVTVLSRHVAFLLTEPPLHWSGLRAVDAHRAGQSHLTSTATLLVAIGMISSSSNRSLPSSLSALRHLCLQTGRPVDQVAYDIAHCLCPVPSFTATGL